MTVTKLITPFIHPIEKNLATNRQSELKLHIDQQPDRDRFQRRIHPLGHIS